MANRAAEKAAEKEREIEWRAALTVTEDFDEHDRETAMAKIADAAARCVRVCADAVRHQS